LSDLILAICGVVGLIVTVLGVAYAYGVFVGNARETTNNARKATERVFARLDGHDERIEILEKIACEDRIDRLERITTQIRERLIQEGLMVPSGTQAGFDGRGIKPPR
jgi:hypothetical protein